MNGRPEYILGLDVGDKRIGVAVAHEVARLPRPLTTLDHTATVQAAIVDLIATEHAHTVVVGLPRQMDGSYSDQTRRAEQFARDLDGVTAADVVLCDETLTSVDAEALLGPGRHAKGDIDAAAAALILDRYFASQAQKVAP